MSTQRFAILADIHGNPIALEAVLKDIASCGGVDQYLMLGDYAALGFDPCRVLKRLMEFKTARFIRGNADRYVVSDDLPFPNLEEALKNPKLLGRFMRVARSFAWTAGAISACGENDYSSWLSGLPLEMRMTLSDGTRVLAVHASPGNDDGVGLSPATSDEDMEKMVAGSEAELVLVAHTHVPFDRLVAGVRVVNPGSIGNPMAPDLRASYAILVADVSGYELIFRRVDYDRQACIEMNRQVKQPSWRYIEQFLLGQQRPHWEAKDPQEE
ncbi:MAG: metallophosphoesterase family protein [Anaerolineales bacterium]|nr:MAG: metallophosphoesterase family protein [Anaerolineales bacterium]